jgi:nucleotide-binding universal stress UspA family protein
MFPKTLLTVIGSEQDTASVQRAISLCETHECHLAVCVIGVALPASTAAYGEVPTEMWSQEREKGRETATSRGNEIEAMLAKSGISGDVSSFYCEEGQIAEIVGTRARYADLALVGPTGGPDRLLSAKVLQGLLYHSAKPFLVVPDNVTATLTPKTVMIAWNATKECARAVHLSMDTLIRADHVHVVMVDPAGGEFDQGEEPGADIAGYLARHGADVTVDAIPSAGKSVTEALLRHATDISAELIVAGAYGHSRLREFLFGGTTRELLANEQIPVLTAH